MDYIQFLKSKIEVAPVSGFTVSEAEINPALKPHQRDAAVLVDYIYRGELCRDGYCIMSIRLLREGGV